MSTTELQGPIVDWAPFYLDAEGNLATQAMVNAMIPFDKVTDLPGYTDMVDQVQAEARAVLTPEAFGVLQDLTAYMQDLAAEEIVPYGEESAFWLYLEYQFHQPSIPTTGNIAAFLTPYVQQWAAARGYNPGPQYVAPPPPALPTPSIGQTTVAKGAREVKPSVVPAPTLSPEQNAAIQTAIGVASADILKVQAAVIDAMLPNLHPGQVTQALDQLNAAVNALGHQMSGVLSDLDINVKGTLAAQLNGALEALHGLSQEVNTLAQDVAMKAESTIGDDVNANTASIAALSGTVATIVGTSIPDLASGITDVTSAVGKLDTTVTNQIEPQLSQVASETNANTQMLSGTDKECLDQLCDAEGNVINPIKEGGATPSLLRKLGSLLGAAWATSAIIALGDAIVTLLDAPLALNAVAQDVEQLSSWAESAATSIEANL